MGNLSTYDGIASHVLKSVDLSPLANKTVMVTGASGLLGSHIVNILTKAAPIYNLHIMAVVQTRLHPEQEPSDRLQVAYANLGNPADCERLPFADVVISAASYAQPKRFLAEPLGALRSSGLGILALLERVRVGGKMLYISSSEVYCDGDPATEKGFTENEIGTITPYHPRACYIVGKQFGEAMTYLYRNRGISTVSVRPGITYGPGFRRGDQRSWAEFVQRAIESNRLELMDAGTVQRTFCYITDGMEMLFKALCYGRHPVYNLSGVHTHTIAHLGEMVAKACNAELIIPPGGEGVGGTPDNLRMDNSRIVNEFGKTQFIDTQIGIDATVEWARKALYA